MHAWGYAWDDSKAGMCLPGIVEPFEAAYSLVGGMPVQKEALSLPHSAVPAQKIAGHAVALTLLGCLPPVLQVTPLQPSLQCQRCLHETEVMAVPGIQTLANLQVTQREATATAAVTTELM